MTGTDHHPIEKVSAEGEPLKPRDNARKFIYQCGVIVRDNIPITIGEWKKLAKAVRVSYVDDRLKEFLWEELISHFSLPVYAIDEETEKMRLNVNKWALKKMAQQFNNFKNTLYRNYVKDKKTSRMDGGTRESGEALARISGVQGIGRG
jgi:hypothetical protein